ncbi:MAG: TPM domain-containing protein [Giesbergeria sp.]|nr:TPM domain-containing protein [Giesbergeria sp.]MBP7915741.1 TPM domain-containing protein [Giesbergeria sp.]MBP8028763.1 TPM domain-containing protein [Giesbergeria sp.]
MVNWIHQTARLLRHRWAENLLRSTASPALLGQLTQAVATSEQRHSGQVRICIEAGLPASYIWRNASARERAIAMFSKLRVWDTEHNNGVLIYLLLAEHAIEIVADRGLARHVPQPVWETLASQLSAALRSGHTAEGLLQALADVSALLELHSPSDASTAEQPRRNELPDAPCIASK